MSRQLNTKEIEAVVRLDPQKRYSYCIKQAADNNALWSLASGDGWVLAHDDDGRELVPVWPHEQFAALCANGIWAGSAPKPVDIDVWLDRWTPGMEKDHRAVAVFPTPQDRGIPVKPDRLAEDLREELSRYE
jgi:hypothetical protein